MGWGCWWWPEQQDQSQSQFGDRAADLSLWAAGVWWPRGQGLAVTCSLCSPEAVLWAGVRDLIPVSAPLCAGTEGGWAQGAALPHLTLAQAVASLASAPVLCSHLLPPCGKLSLAAGAGASLRLPCVFQGGFWLGAFLPGWHSELGWYLEAFPL